MTNTIDTTSVAFENLDYQYNEEIVAVDDEVTVATDNAQKAKTSRRRIYANTFRVFSVIGLITSFVYMINIMNSAKTVVDEVTATTLTTTYHPIDFLGFFIAFISALLFAIICFALVNENITDDGAASNFGGFAGFLGFIAAPISIFLLLISPWIVTQAGEFAQNKYVPSPSAEGEAFLESIIGEDYSIVGHSFGKDTSSAPKADTITFISQDNKLYKFNTVVDGNTIVWTVVEADE
jgi:hypothetical protein